MDCLRVGADDISILHRLLFLSSLLFVVLSGESLTIKQVFLSDSDKEWVDMEELLSLGRKE